MYVRIITLITLIFITSSLQHKSQITRMLLNIAVLAFVTFTITDDRQSFSTRL